MTLYTTTTDIEAAPSRVWPVMIDVEHWHEWTPSIQRIEKLEPGPLRVGGRARVYQPKLLPAVWEVTEIDPGRSFTWVSRAPGALVIGRHHIDALDNGRCRVTLAVDYSGPIGKVVGRVFGNVTQRYIDMEANGLKQRCEIQVQTLSG